MKRFTKSKKVLYIAETQESAIHYVPEIRWLEYLENRKVVPILCVLFQTIEDAEQCAAYEERTGLLWPGSRKEVHYKTHTITDMLEYCQLLGSVKA